ncbi:MAG: dCTP deaminase [Candidatus Aenigmatarchaeota archaeon]|nr:MAG: dCTP deaminase [Candidatus Aenigmarchaeota archaeon]
MILSDREIKKYLETGSLVVKPIDDPDVQIQSAGIDLRLGSEFRIFKTAAIPYIDTRKEQEVDYTEKVSLDDGRPFIIHPGEFVLAPIKEYIRIPSDLAASVDGKSSLGRIGISIHATSASINPGWEGYFVLEITNVGRMPVALYPGMRIAKLVLHKLSSECERPYDKRPDTKYNKENSTSDSRIYREAQLNGTASG